MTSQSHQRFTVEGLRRCSTAALVHGGTRGRRRTREYAAWISMRGRCNRPSDTAYPNYGGRGISVCRRWDSFVAFRDDMGECPSGYTLDRIDVDGNYEPGNCRWVSRAEQNRNKRTNAYVVFRGERLAMAEACRRAGVPYETVRWHVRVKGKSHQAAFDYAVTR